MRYIDRIAALNKSRLSDREKEKHLNELKANVDRFILKFDYRNKDLPWENAKDAPKRALQTLAGAELE